MADDVEQVELLTLTRLWLFPRYLFRFLDRPLGSPWNLRLLGLALPTFVVTFLLLAVLTPFTPTGGLGLGLVPYLLVPGLLVWWALTRVAAGAKLWEVVWSHVRLLAHARRRRDAIRVTRFASRLSGPGLRP